MMGKFRLVFTGLYFSLVCLLAGVVSINAADVLPVGEETWDATTLDLHGEMKSLAGTWEYVPWDDLDKVPDFKNGQPAQVPIAPVPGAYRRKISVEAEKGTRRVILHFDAVAYRCAVFINGRQMGSHAGGLTPFEFDVSDEVHSGENDLVVVVLGDKGTYLSTKSHKASEITFNDRSQAVSTGGDKKAFGVGSFVREGIRQGVYVREVPLLRIADVTVTTSFRKKEITAQVKVANQETSEKSVTIRVEVLPYDIESKTPGTIPIWTKQEKIEAKLGLSSVNITHGWSDPQLWMPGDPHLYVARIKVMDESGNLLNERNVRFGFREVWLEGRKIVVNGKPFRAYVHGTLDTEAAPSVTRAAFQQLMESGINMVRPHTMPPVHSFTQIADEMGMGIIGEGELTFNRNYAYEEPIFWENYERLHRERIARDKNHPSILIWSLANEVIICSPGAKIGQHFYDAFRNLKEVDPTRPFMQEGDGDLRDMLPDAKGFPIDIINLHLYDVSPTKNPLWATEFPPVAWAVESIKTPREIPGATKFGIELPDASRPWFIGEFGLAVSGAYPDFFSFWTGPEAYRGLFGHGEELVRAIGETVVMQLQAFRELDMAGMDPWDLPDKLPFRPYLLRAFEPVTVFTRELTSHWFSGGNAKRQLVVMNDSFEAQNLTLRGALKQGDHELSREEQVFALLPGEKKKPTLEFALPEVSERTVFELGVQLMDANGKQVFGFTQKWIVYPRVAPAPARASEGVWLCGSEANLGDIANWIGRPLRTVEELNSHPRKQDVSLIVFDGDTFAGLTGETQLAVGHYLANGGVVFALGADQVSFQDIELVANHESDSTRVFPLRQNPLTSGTSRDDWEFWWPDHYVSRGNYPMSFDPAMEFPLVGGGRNGPLYSPLAVRKIGKGFLIASRLLLNQSVQVEPVAQIFLSNLMKFSALLKENAKNETQAEIVLICPSPVVEKWKERLAKERIPVSAENQIRTPGREAVLLTGDAVPSPEQVMAISQFLANGGTLWVHGLSPETPYLDQLAKWIDSPIALRPPVMWLQQFELNPSQNFHPLLNGLTDFHACWATFGWTNGNMYSVRTTPIADYVLQNPGDKGASLFLEPEWIGTWDVTSSQSGTLSQKILRSLGTHSRNEMPGVGLAVYPSGQGRVIIDQFKWDEVMAIPSSESKDKALYFSGTLWKNISESLK